MGVNKLPIKVAYLWLTIYGMREIPFILSRGYLKWVNNLPAGARLSRLVCQSQCSLGVGRAGITNRIDYPRVETPGRQSCRKIHLIPFAIVRSLSVVSHVLTKMTTLIKSSSGHLET